MLNIKTEPDGKQVIIVPKGIRYISDWTDYNLADPRFQTPHILNKKIPGCGFTEYCLRSNHNVILISPRRILLENKEAQHKGEVFYFYNDLEKVLDYDADLTANSGGSGSGGRSVSAKQEEATEQFKALRKKLARELTEYINMRLSFGKPVKILVTYDSFRHVRDVIGDTMIQYYYEVIDEFQSIFTDSRFKAEVELNFMESLRGLSRVCFVSATPMMDEYLKELDEFKGLPYYELDWKTEDPDRVKVPSLDVRYLNSVNREIKPIIDNYKCGKFESLLLSSGLAPDGIERYVESKEAVFYVNSVSNIISIIDKCDIKPEECNILCARTSENEKKIRRRLGKDYQIGSVPLYGEPHKMFTFCTRTVYLGADFYSTNARTFVFANANIDSLAVDISLDLPQILGRQRLKENPWKDKATIFVKPLAKSKAMTKDDYYSCIDKKIDSTNKLLKTYADTAEDCKSELRDMYCFIIQKQHYQKNYLGMKTRAGAIPIPVFNKLVMISEKRAFDIQQIDYRDRFSVFNAFDSLDHDGVYTVGGFEIDRMRWKDSKISFAIRFKEFCNSSYSDKNVKAGDVSPRFDKFYNNLTQEEIKKCGYNPTDMTRLLNYKAACNSSLPERVHEVFKVGDRWSNADAKAKLGEIFNELGIKKTPKASILAEKWFNVKPVKYRVDGVDINGFDIISKK